MGVKRSLRALFDLQKRYINMPEDAYDGFLLKKPFFCFFRVCFLEKCVLLCYNRRENKARFLTNAFLGR